MKKLNEAFDTLKDHFEGAFHTTLWNILVENVTGGKLACFVMNYGHTGLQLGVAIANEAGYMPTPAYFKDTQYDRANLVLDNLNEIVFGLEPEACMRITMTSMRRPVANKGRDYVLIVPGDDNRIELLETKKMNSKEASELNYQRRMAYPSLPGRWVTVSSLSKIENTIQQ